MATPAQSMAWLSANKRWFLPVAIGVPVVVGGLAFGVTALLVMDGLKQSPPYAVALQAVRDSEAVAGWIGSPLEPGFIVQGSVEAEPGTGEPAANLMFSVTGPDGGAGVRAYLIEATDAGPGRGGWTLHYLDAGVKTHAGREAIVVVTDTGRRPADLARVAPPVTPPVTAP